MEDKTIQTVVLGGGCFWCVEAIFQLAPGVLGVRSGYSGGSAQTANYEAVCSGKTQHAEVVELSFDPSLISLEKILYIFFSTHDPTTLNRQGGDRGPQYRSVIFYQNEEQRQVAERVMRDTAAQLWDDPIVTELAPFEAFYPAETYHQNYYQSVGERNPYCSFVITPKVSKFRKMLANGEI